MGWAHNYSLPREISLAADGTIIQKPYGGLTAMRTTTTISKTLELSGSQSLAPVSGRQIELLGEFTVASGTCGFHFLKSGNKLASLTYDTDRGTLTLDLTQLDRVSNDGGSYNGIYTATLPKKVNAGEKLKLHVYVDGSIVDIFVNDTWAFSVRVFPTDASATEAEVFATSTMTVSVQAWTLDPKQKGEDGISPVVSRLQVDSRCYDLQGRQLQTIPQKGFYIKNGKKYIR